VPIITKSDKHILAQSPWYRGSKHFSAYKSLTHHGIYRYDDAACFKRETATASGDSHPCAL
jgi:hypothetical protein